MIAERRAMGANAAAKPVFSRDQIVSATTVSKKFSEVRKRAKVTPIFVSDRNEIDTVIMDYITYENMYVELAALREENLYAKAEKRIQDADAASSNDESIALEDALSASELTQYGQTLADSASDEELFE